MSTWADDTSNLNKKYSGVLSMLYFDYPFLHRILICSVFRHNLFKPGSLKFVVSALFSADIMYISLMKFFRNVVLSSPLNARNAAVQMCPQCNWSFTHSSFLILIDYQVFKLTARALCLLSTKSESMQLLYQGRQR